MDNEPLTLKFYQEQARLTDRGQNDLTLLILGLLGEIGTLLSEVKKQRRDTDVHVDYNDNITEDLGDILWYLTSIASRSQISMADVASAISQDYDSCSVTALSHVPIADIQKPLPRAPLKPTSGFEITLLHLAGAVGALVTDHGRKNIETKQLVLSEHIMAIFRNLIQVADEGGFDLELVAKRNIEKIFDRWPEKYKYPRLFDDKFPTHEQLPRQLSIKIFEHSSTDKNYVMQICNGIIIGDRLTDNRVNPDDYRFHDVFHYAYAAILGWSPVTRALFRLKRKSDDRIDEGEDGARAILIEEGVTTWIFGRARQIDFFENVSSGDLSFNLLKDIRKFVAGYEVESCPLWLWEEAILQGYAAFRFFKKHRRGIIHIDMRRRQLTVERLLK